MPPSGGYVPTAYRLAFASNIYLDQANSLRGRIATILERTDFGSLTIMFSSEGGNTDQSLALYYYLRSLPVPIRMHAVGHVGSASVPVFLAGHRRTIAPYARFFFHEYDWVFDGRQTLRRIDEAAQRLRSDIETAREIITTRTTSLPPVLLQALDGVTGPVIVTPEEAKTFGIVDEICELGQQDDQGMPVAVWTV
jgi:ATP-dependent Clp protease protease subunit